MFVFQIRNETPAYLYALKDLHTGEISLANMPLEQARFYANAAHGAGYRLEVVARVDERDAAINRVMSSKEFIKPILN